jgi:hypothetical protein
MAQRRRRSNPEPDPQEFLEAKPSVFVRLGRALLKTFFRPKRLLLLALIPTVAAVSPALYRAWPDLNESPVYRLKASEIRITPPPRPVPANLVERAVGTAGLEAELSVLDQTLLPRLAEAFAKEPWVRQVIQLRKGLPAHVEIELEYRRPVAMIDVKQGVYPIDEEGVLLPPADFSAAESRRYPLVTGVRSLPAGPPGTPWDDATVLGAAKIAAALAAHWDELDLTSIQAPPLATASVEAEDLTFELHTRGGSKIIWGRPPGTGHPGELTADQKIGRLKRYVADFGPLGAPGPPFEIDIRSWQEITRRPLATATRPTTTRR